MWRRAGYLVSLGIMNQAAQFCERAIAYLRPALNSTKDSFSLPRPNLPVLRDFENGLLVSYLVDDGGSFKYVQNHHIVDAGITLDQLHSCGIANLAAIANQSLRVESYGALYAVFLDGNFEASLILLDALWDKGLARYVTHGIATALPARDVLAFCDSSSSEGLVELASLIERAVDADHRLIDSILYRHGRAWTLHDA
jgi:uncharacterized protein YtpQ (UPF0354 family)